MLSQIIFIVILHFGCLLSFHIDPSEFFTGAQHRPRLEIIHPENGQVLDNGDLEIRIKISGYEVPSQFHNSRVCVGLSSIFATAEQVGWFC